MVKRSVTGVNERSADRLLLAVAEQMRLPLLQIARSAELADKHSLNLIETTATRTLEFIDSYLLSAHVLVNQLKLELEPISLSSVVADAAAKLDKVAREYGCSIHLELGGKFGPVMANRVGLEAALTNLGTVLIESQNYDNGQKPQLTLAVHGSRGGVVAGVFSAMPGLNLQTLRRGQALHGHARQTIGSIVASNGAGVFVADSLLGAMSAKLRVAHYHKLSGLAATFAPSQQLSLI